MANTALGSPICRIWVWSDSANCPDEVTGSAVWVGLTTSFFGAAGGAPLEADQATPSARRRPIKQQARPIKARGLKKADFEISFFFIGMLFLGLQKRGEADRGKSCTIASLTRKGGGMSRK